MVKYIPPGFNEAKILDGLGKAMGFGEPTRAEDKATFYFVRRAAPTVPADDGGVPFDPAVRPQNAATPTKLVVQCAVEFFDRESVAISSSSEVRPSRIKITLLDPEWQQVKDFTYVVASGDKYNRGTLEPVVALGSIDVFTVWAVSEDER